MSETEDKGKERFKCKPLLAVLTRADCGYRHHVMRNKDRHSREDICAKCTVGAQHAAGRPAQRWPGGHRVELAGPLPELAQEPTPDGDAGKKQVWPRKWKVERRSSWS